MVGTKVKLGQTQQCNQCKYSWLPRKDKIIRCPDCGSVHWDEDKK